MAVRDAARGEELFGRGVGGCLRCGARLGVDGERGFGDDTFNVRFARLGEEKNGRGNRGRKVHNEIAIEGGGGLGFVRVRAVGGDESLYSWGMAVGHAVLGEAGEDGFHEFADHGEFEEELELGGVRGIEG